SQEAEFEKSILYSIEKSSEHPLADAITHYLEKEFSDYEFLNSIQVENESGKGIKGKFETEYYFIGNPTFLEEQGIQLDLKVKNWIAKELNLARTVILFSNSQKIYAGISLSDKIKET